DVLRIPKDAVIHRGKPDASGRLSSGPTPLATAPAGTDPHGFYESGSLKPRPVKELVRQYGEAVILVEAPSGLGSGFLVNSDGFAVTNNHVIEGETRISVVIFQNTPGGIARRKVENVEIVALNPFVDLALLKLPPQKDLKLPHVVLGN